MLELFYSNPNRPFYVREITRKIDEQINSVRRELANLLNAGIIVSENTNNKLYYEVNQQYEFYSPLSEIFGKQGAASRPKKVQLSEEAAVVANIDDDQLKALGNIELALYTGQFTRDDSSGVDLLLVGNVNENQVTKYVSQLEANEGKEIRYAILSPSDFQYRLKIKDKFVSTVLMSKVQVLIDKNGVVG